MNSGCMVVWCLCTWWWWWWWWWISNNIFEVWEWCHSPTMNPAFCSMQQHRLFAFFTGAHIFLFFFCSFFSHLVLEPKTRWILFFWLIIRDGGSTWECFKGKGLILKNGYLGLVRLQYGVKTGWRSGCVRVATHTVVCMFVCVGLGWLH